MKRDNQRNNFNTKDLPLYLFHQGTNYNSYDFMGAHFGEKNGEKGVYFRTWAPRAEKVFIVGDFNNWHVGENELTKITDGGVFETFVSNLKTFDSYKFAIFSNLSAVQQKNGKKRYTLFRFSFIF